MIVLDREGKVAGNNLKLHLGCWNRYIDNWINVDCRGKPDTQADVVDNVITLDKFNIKSASVIYSCHCAEHFTRKESISAFTRWRDILESNGVLRLSVPDLERIFEHYMFYKDLRLWENMIYGKQGHEFDYHYNGWDFKTLKEDLESIGFINVRRYDCSKTEHSHVDDHSFAYFPHMDFNGTCMSLNVEASIL